MARRGGLVYEVKPCKPCPPSKIEWFMDWSQTMKKLNLSKKTLVYENQRKCALEVLDGIQKGFLFQLVLAQTQSGKTGMMVTVAEGCKKDVVVMSGLSNIDWKKQTIGRFSEKVPVYHRNDLKNVKKLEHCVVLIDEVQYASGAGMTLDGLLEDCGCKDIETLRQLNVHFVLVSATPNRIYDDLCELSSEWCRHLVMQPGDGYTGLQELLQSGRLREAKDLWVAGAVGDDENAGVKRFNEKMISKSLEAIEELKDVVTSYKDPKYHIVRTQYAAAGEEVRERFKTVFLDSVDFVVCDSTTGVGVMEKVKVKPARQCVLFIKEQLRCAATLVKTHIGVLYDRVSKLDNVMVQGLAGRGTGYDVPECLVVFSDVKSIQRYLAVVEEGFESMQGLKCSGEVTMMHREGFVVDDGSDGSTVVSEVASVA